MSDKWGGSKGKNQDVGEDYGSDLGIMAGASTGPAPMYIGSEVGGPVGRQIGGLFGSEGTKYGRYYHEISADDSDYQEDANEQRFLPRMKQNVIDRYVMPERGIEHSPITRQALLREGGRFNLQNRLMMRQLGMRPGVNMLYRNSDRIEDVNERVYAIRHNQQKRAEKFGLEKRSKYLEGREKKAADRAMKQSKFQEQNKLFK